MLDDAEQEAAKEGNPIQGIPMRESRMRTIRGTREEQSGEYFLTLRAAMPFVRLYNTNVT